MSEQTVYAVFREKIYRHACCGIFADIAAARACADNAATADIDSHHWYRVFAYPLGEALPIEPCLTGHWSPQIGEADPVYETRKSLG